MVSFFPFLIIPSAVISSLVPTHEIPRETTQPPVSTVAPSSSSRTIKDLKTPLEAFLSEQIVPEVNFGEFTDALYGIFFAGYSANVLSRKTDLLFDNSEDNLGSIKIVPYVDYSVLSRQLDDAYRLRGTNITALAGFSGRISKPESLDGSIRSGVLKALGWRANPPLPKIDKESKLLDSVSARRLSSELSANEMVLLRFVQLSESPFQLEYLVLKLLLRDGEEKQARFAECLKLIGESPAYELPGKIIPSLREEIKMEETSRVTLQIALVRIFKLFKLTSFSNSYDGIERVKEYFSDEIRRKLYSFSIDGIFPLVIGNFNANKSRKSAPSGLRSLGYTYIDSVYVGEGIDRETLEKLKEALGYDEFSNRFEKIGNEKDETLGANITELLRGRPERSQIIGVLLGWLRESAKFIMQENLSKVLA